MRSVSVAAVRWSPGQHLKDPVIHLQELPWIRGGGTHITHKDSALQLSWASPQAQDLHPLQLLAGVFYVFAHFLTHFRTYFAFICSSLLGARWSWLWAATAAEPSAGRRFSALCLRAIVMNNEFRPLQCSLPTFDLIKVLNEFSVFQSIRLSPGLNHSGQAAVVPLGRQNLPHKQGFGCAPHKYLANMCTSGSVWVRVHLVAKLAECILPHPQFVLRSGLPLLPWIYECIYILSGSYLPCILRHFFLREIPFPFQVHAVNKFMAFRRLGFPVSGFAWIWLVFALCQKVNNLHKAFRMLPAFYVLSRKTD